MVTEYPVKTARAGWDSPDAEETAGEGHDETRRRTSAGTTGPDLATLFGLDIGGPDEDEADLDSERLDAPGLAQAPEPDAMAPEAGPAEALVSS